MRGAGPDIGDGSFKAAAVKSIHYKRLPVGAVVAGQTAALALKKTKRSQVGRRWRFGAFGPWSDGSLATAMAGLGVPAWRTATAAKNA